MKLTWIVLAIAILCLSSVTLADDEPVLTINTQAGIISVSRNKLLSNKKIEHMTMSDSRAYPGININFTVIKLCNILKLFHVSNQDTLELIAVDQFSALVPAKLVMNCRSTSSIAYLAIETKQQPWPRLSYNNPDLHNPESGSAGPFQIIWLHPEKSYVSNEYWAWKVVSIHIHSVLDKRLYLQAPATKNRHIQNGYKAYASRCLGCHTLNNVGKGKIGPDLNKPVSAVTRFHDDYLLKKFIRDPQSVRQRKNDRMSGTSEMFLSQRDMDDLVLYLHYMAERASRLS